MSNYSIAPGIREFETADSTLYVVCRRTGPDTPRDVSFNTVIQPIDTDDAQQQAWVSILFSPEKLGGLKLWRDVPRLDPHSVVRQFEQNLSRGAEKERAVIRLTQLSLMAAGGHLQQPAHDGIIHTMVENAPLFDRSIRQPLQLHVSAEGVLRAHLKRRAAQRRALDSLV